MADEAYCAACEAHFGSAETLARHQEAFHKPRAPAAPPTPTAEVNFDDGSNLEIAPLLAVLTEAQKDVLLMRAIARVPELADSLLQLVESPLTPEGAADRVAELRGDTGVSIVRAYAEIGSAANALCMLTALTEAVVGSLEELLDLLPTSTSTSATSSAATKRTSEERDRHALLTHVSTCGSLMRCVRYLVVAAGRQVTSFARWRPCLLQGRSQYCGRRCC